MPSHDAVSFPLPRISCIAAAVLGGGCSLCMIKVAATRIKPARRCFVVRRLTSSTIVLTLCRLGHVAPGLDLLHQHSCGKSCCWTCLQVSLVNRNCVWIKDEKRRVKQQMWGDICNCGNSALNYSAEGPDIYLVYCLPASGTCVVTKWTKSRLRSPSEFQDSCHFITSYSFDRTSSYVNSLFCCFYLKCN